MNSRFFDKNPILSPVVKTMDGLYIHLRYVDSLCAKGFGDEEDSMMELRGEKPIENVTNPQHLWAKIGDATYVIPLEDEFNCDSMGVFYYSTERRPSMERRMVELWAELKWNKGER